MDDIEEILSDCGIRGGLRTITQGMSDQNKAKQIFLILLADKADKFPDRHGSWARAKARFEEHILDCWQARASMIEDEDSYIRALEELQLEYDEDDTKKELQQKIKDVIENKELIRQDIENRKAQSEEARRNAKRTKKTPKKNRKSKRQKKRKEIDYALRIVRHKINDQYGYIEKKHGENWLVRWAPYRSPAVEQKIDEIWVEIDTIDEIPNLGLLDKKFIIDAQEWEIGNRVTGQVTGFDGHSGEFNVRFSEEVGAFWLDKHNFKKSNWLIKEKFINDFLERAKARGKPGPLVHPDKG